jgi:hypothetical protein
MKKAKDKNICGKSFIYYTAKEKMDNLRLNNNPSSLNSNYVNSIYTDHTNNLWVGTYTGGLNKYFPNRNRYNVYQNIRNDKGSLKNNFIADIYIRAYAG